MTKESITTPFNPYALWVVMARRRITAPKLAKKLGKKTSKINRYLLGMNEPSEADLKTLSRVLKWPVGFFSNLKVQPPDWSSI
jgi:transcriptional regulator with XRE-family HTH domain